MGILALTGRFPLPLNISSGFSTVASQRVTKFPTSAGVDKHPSR